jgi:2-polyprenyl-6-methoxyphenol hydroxylase-like FAD-dependent oxidoreductase
VVVFEREKAHGERRRDWSILLHWGMPMFTKLLPESTIERLPEAICNPHLTFDEDVESVRAVNGKTGEQIFRNPTPGARPITRQRLRTVLLRDLEEADVIRWGQRLVNIEAGESGPVKLAFEDGSTHEADYVLGADGASSKVRELLFKGDESAKVQYSGFMFASVVAKYGDAEKVETFEKSHPVTTILFGEDSVGGFGSMSSFPTVPRPYIPLANEKKKYSDACRLP